MSLWEVNVGIRADQTLVQNRQTARMPPSTSVPAFPALWFPSDSSFAVFYYWGLQNYAENTWNKKSQKSFAMSSHQDQEGVVVSFRGVVRQKLICLSPHPLNSFHTFIKARLTGRRNERGGQTLTVILHPGSQYLKFSSHQLFLPRFNKMAFKK